MDRPKLEVKMGSEESHSVHWADRAAGELIQVHPEKTEFVCASGISPSGMVHIGNFREVITVDLVVRALKDRGKKVRFIYSWDDYDAFRKVPANLPMKEMLEKHLRLPISKVPDPFGDCPSYAAHFERQFEKEIYPLGIKPEFIYQHIPYSKGDYRDGIEQALKYSKQIIAILNQARTETLEEDWTPISVFCENCGKDTTEIQRITLPKISYRCISCQKDLETDLTKGGGVKLLWRVDWPMRWARENVDFEPGGKDHSSPGGSFDTGKEIIERVWKKKAPHYLQYDFVLTKGLGTKLSSSSGQLITLGEALEIYEPEVIRWIFASRKPNIDFSIAFDLDVMKAYDDFDRSERYAYGVEPEDGRRTPYERRIYEFSQVAPSLIKGAMPPQFPFRHLCNVLQIHQGNLDRASLSFQIKSGTDRERFRSRAQRAWKWITTYAPAEFRFSLRPSESPPPKTKFSGAISDLVRILRQETSLSEEEVSKKLFEIMKKHSIEPRIFYQDIYGILIDKSNGPRLASFLIAIEQERAASLLELAL